MRFKKFLNEGIVQNALDLPEPKIGQKYPSEKIKRYLEMISKALKEMSSKEENEANDAIVADLRDKKDKWSNVKKETKPIIMKKEEPPPEQQEEEPPPEEEEPPPEPDKEKDETKRKFQRK